MRTILILFALFFYSCQGISQSFEGVWKGEIQIQGMTLPLVFELEHSDGWSGTMQSPAQAQMKFPLTKVQIEGDSVYMEAASLQLSFGGRMQTGSEHIVGVFRQGGLQLDLELRRADAVEAVHTRPQEPNPPYPYDTLDVKFTNPHDQTILAGTITKPKEAGKYPAVVLVTGSGPQNRDEELMGHKPFKVIADYLTRNGIIVLRYDDRGMGESTGNFVQGTIGDFSKDATAALSFLRSQPDVDTDKVGLIGHSEGGLIAFLMAGQQVSDMNFGIALAGPAISIDSLMVQQLYHVGKSQGMAEEQLEAVRPINQRNFDIIKSDIPKEAARQQLLKNMASISGGNTTALEKELEVMLMAPYRYFIRIDPVPFIQQIRIPMFAAFGEKDVQVPPAENMESLADHLPENPKSQTKIYPSLNHLFQPAETGAVSEYAQIETTIDEQVLEDMVSWIKAL